MGEIRIGKELGRRGYQVGKKSHIKILASRKEEALF